MAEAILPPASKTPEMAGYIYKWVNYLRGWQKRWVVLQENGTLYYYKNAEDVGSNCRGSLSMKDVIITQPRDSNNILLTKMNNETVHFKWQNLEEKAAWVAALYAARKRLENVVLPNEEDDEEDMASGRNSQDKVTALIAEFTQKVDELKTSLDLVSKHFKPVEAAMAQMNLNDRELMEKVTLFRVTSSAHLNKSREIVDFANTLSTKYLALLQQEREQKDGLNEILEQLAQQHSNLEQLASKQARRHSIETTQSDEEFYDAYEVPEQQQMHPDLQSGEDSESVTTLAADNPTETDSAPPKGNMAESTWGSGSSISFKAAKTLTSAENAESDTEEDTSVLFGQKEARRERIKDRPEVVMSLWSIIKNCLGKDLSKIPMPVNFNEPISMLQRLAEDFEYYDILDRAAEASDDYEQMALVSAFTVSSYSTTAKRTNKPFNPLLFETFEMDRMSDLGFRLISEQVSHHPPIIAQFVEGRNWKCWQEFSMATKFKGSYLQIVPLGITHLQFTNKNHYTWRKVATTVNNLILGSLWIDQAGRMEIVNHTKNITAEIKFEPYRLMSVKQQRSILGCVSPTGGSTKHWQISGHWDTHVDVTPATWAYPNCEKAVPDEDSQWGKPLRVWTVNPPLPRSEKWYNLSKFAVQLNEFDNSVAPTDSRRRPDQRLMENGDFEGANKEKVRLEEKQRAVRREKEAEAQELRKKNLPVPSHQPIWFEQKTDEMQSMIYTYNHKYWKAKRRQEWSQCPDIF